VQDPKRRQVRAVPTHAGELANLGEAEKIGYHGFTAAVLTRPIAVETIAAGAVSRSTSGVDRPFSSMNQAKARTASTRHCVSPSAFLATARPLAAIDYDTD